MSKELGGHGYEGWRADDEGRESRGARRRGTKRGGGGGADRRRERDAGIELPPESRSRLEELQRRLDAGGSLDKGEQEQYDAFVGVVGGSEQWLNVWQSMPPEARTDASATPAVNTAEVTTGAEPVGEVPAEPAVEALPADAGRPVHETASESLPETATPVQTSAAGEVGTVRPKTRSRSRLTGREDPRDLDQGGLYELKRVLGKTLKGDELEGAIKKVDRELRRRGDEVRAARHRVPETIAPASAPDAPAAEVVAEPEVPVAPAEAATAYIPPGTFEARPVEPVTPEPTPEELDEASAELLQLITQARSDLNLYPMTPEQQREMGTLYDWLGDFDEKIRSGEGRDVARSAEFWRALTAMTSRRIELGFGDPAELGPRLEQTYGRYLDQDDPKFVENSRPLQHAYTLETISRVRGVDVAVGLYGQLTEKLHRLDVSPTDPWGVSVSEDFHDLLMSRASVLSTRLSELPAEEQARFTAMGERFNQPPDQTPVDERIEQVAEYIKTLETALAPKEAARAPLTDKRLTYAKALRSQSKILFGRTSKQELAQRREDYHAAITEEVQKKIEEIKAEFGGLPEDPQREAELNGKITELVLNNRVEEEQALVTAMKESADQSAAQRFQRFWKKHTKARLVIGVGLLGGTVAATLTGQFGVAAGLQALRVPMSGVGGTMTIESLAEIARSKFGKAKEIKSEEEIKSLDDDELEQRLAAHETSFVDLGGKDFGVKKRGVWKKREDATGQRLQAEYRRRHEAGVKQMVAEYQQEGRKPDEIVAKLLEASLDEQRSHSAALEQRRASDRRFAIVKWTTAVAGGAALAALSGLGAARHARVAAEGPEAAKAAAKAAREGLIRVVKAPGDTLARLWQGAKAAADSARVDTVGVAHLDTAQVEAPAFSDTVHAASADTSQVASADTLGAAAPDSALAAQADTSHIAAAQPDTSHAAFQPDTTHAAAAQPDTAHAAAPADTSHAAAEPSVVTEPSAEQGTEAATAGTAAEAAEAKVSAVETVKKGDSLWKVLERQLHERMGERFDNLDEARKTFMIDAMKDQVVANPAEFGLDNADHLEIGQQLDLSHLFSSDQAADLNQLHDQAVGLDQHAVDSITQHNEQLRDWVHAHPHEALTSEKAEQILSGKTAAAEVAAQTQSSVEPALSEHVQQDWVDKLSSGLRERLLCELAEKHPEEYLKAHAANPDLYPEVAGVTDTAHQATETAAETGAAHLIHLTPSGLEAQHRYADALRSVYETTPRPAADGIFRQLGEMKVGEAMKKGALERAIDQMEGGTHDKAKRLAGAVRRLVKAIPKYEYEKTDTLETVFKRIPPLKK
ncbi:MAG: hypothetical protein HY420_04080 [Candidatus Kerfeldbacteria bacterium]|nr:hypothetical protein [Candidatus Kerfeldbacteria bacterium]